MKLHALLFLATVAYGNSIPEHFPERFNAQPIAAGTIVDAAVDKWWETFGDPQLSNLIARAVKQNLDVRLASQRVLESKAERRISRAALLPSINNTDSFQRIRGGFENGNIHVGDAGGGGLFVQPFESNLFQVGLDASWEIDLFGGRRHELQAATAEVVSSQEAQRDVLLAVLGEVSSTYMELRGTQERRAITERNLALQQDSLHLTEVRAQAGLGTQLDVERQRQQVQSTQALLPTFDAEIAADIHALSILIGEQPTTLETELAVANPLPNNPPVVPIGLPADLLNRRPDLRRARAELVASAARVGAAKADLFPRITLTGAVGRQSTDLSSFTLGAGNFFSVGPGVTIPIFEAGRIRANIAARKQQLEEAQTSYQSALLQALRETEDALTRYGREQQRRQNLFAAVDASKQAAQLSQELYTRGLTDFLSVLDAQREQLANQDALAQSETALRTDLVTLYKSLGGGWAN
jgi:NodT family efflux transporter outer membrane factor (OMF) lipoprotein